jgi:hypothetical protein
MLLGLGFTLTKPLELVAPSTLIMGGGVGSFVSSVWGFGVSGIAIAGSNVGFVGWGVSSGVGSGVGSDVTGDPVASVGTLGRKKVEVGLGFTSATSLGLVTAGSGLIMMVGSGVI